MGTERYSRNKRIGGNHKIGGINSPNTMLIVCEGETEVNYLEQFRIEKRAKRESIRIEKAKMGTNPKNIIDSALEVVRQRPNYFDYVFLVFDRDQHKAKTNNFQSFLDRINTLNENKNKPLTNVKDFRAIISVPCTELWFLLHFNDVAGVKNVDSILRDLKTKPGFNDYVKAKSDAYAPTKELISTAMKHAKLRQDEHQREALEIDKHCYTNLDILVHSILNIVPEAIRP